MPPRPHANKFTSATAIFGILRMAENAELVTVDRVRRDLGVSERQARDYLAFLVEMGRLQVTKRAGVHEYHLVRQGGAGGDVLQQAVGAEFAVAALGALRGTAFHEAASKLVRTLRESLRDAQGQRIDRLRTAFYAARGSAPVNADHAANADVILDAIMFGHALKATYELLADGSMRDYVLRPLWLVVHHEGLHLLARKRDGKIRTFDVEGFRTIERVRTATRPSKLDVEEHFAHAFGRYTSYPPQDVELRLRGVAARQVRRRQFHPSQTIFGGEDGEALVQFHIGICPEFEAWLLGMAPDVEVLKPADLREKMRLRHLEGAKRNTTP